MGTYTVDELVSGGYQLEDITAAGLTNKLKESKTFTLKSLIAKQFSIADLRDAGFSAIEIKVEMKCEDAELLDAGFQQEDIEEKIMQQKDEEPHEDTGSKRQKKMKK